MFLKYWLISCSVPAARAVEARLAVYADDEAQALQRAVQCYAHRGVTIREGVHRVSVIMGVEINKAHLTFYTKARAMKVLRWAENPQGLLGGLEDGLSWENSNICEHEVPQVLMVCRDAERQCTPQIVTIDKVLPLVNEGWAIYQPASLSA